MFSVVEVTGPVFYLDWSGRLVEIRANDSLAKDDLISSLSNQRITLKTPAGENLTITASEPKPVEELVVYASSAPKSNNPKSSLPLKALIEHHFNGTIIEDEGIGACGRLQALDASATISAQAFSGKFGSIEVRESGEWVYFLSEDAMDGELTSPWAQFEEPFTLQAAVGGDALPFELTPHLEGTEDIPDIIGANISSRSEHESETAEPPRKPRAELELMSMIGELLMTN